MNIDQIINLINTAIKTKRLQVIDALKKSRVFVSIDISDQQLLNLIVKELNNGNGYLIYNLGEVITELLEPQKQHSNMVPLLAASIISTGASVLGSVFGHFFGGGGGGGGGVSPQQAAAAAAESAQQAALQRQMVIAAAEAEAARIKGEIDSRKQKSATTRTIIIVSSVVVSLALITTLTIVIFKHKNKNK